LYERHSELVFRLAMRAVQDRAEALDVLQDAFVRASKAIGGFRGESSFRSWIARIAINEANSALRKRGRRRESALEDARQLVDDAALPDERAERRDLAERALAAARTLPALQRDVLLLRTTEGYSYREIAEILGTSEGSARVSYHHALQKLRELLATIESASGSEME